MRLRPRKAHDAQRLNPPASVREGVRVSKDGLREPEPSGRAVFFIAGSFPKATRNQSLLKRHTYTQTFSHAPGSQIEIHRARRFDSDHDSGARNPWPDGQARADGQDPLRVSLWHAL